MARPSTYSKAILEKANDYLQNYEDQDDMIPSVEGLCSVIERARSTVYKWRDEKPEFSDILEKINEEQKRVLINNGLSGDFNSNITKLVLGKHGFSDKSELSGPEGGRIPLSLKVEYVNPTPDKT